MSNAKARHRRRYRFIIARIRKCRDLYSRWSNPLDSWGAQ